MFNNTQLIDILKLFKLNYYEENGRLYVFDPETNESTSLKADGKKGYHFSIGDKMCFFNKSMFVLDMQDVEFIINENDTSYLRRDQNTQVVATTFNLNNDAVSFYSYNNNTSSGLTLYYDENSRFYRIRKSESFNDEIGVNKEDLDFNADNNDSYKHTIRRYDLKGNLVSGCSVTKASDVPVQECINDQLKNSTTIPEIMDEMEKSIPGITDFYSKLNPIMQEISKKMLKSSQKMVSTN